MHKNVSILSINLALMMSCTSLIVATSALVGFNLAENKALATLPLAVQFIAVMLTSIPAAMLMQKIGRKAAFMYSCCFGIMGGVLASYAILNHNFWLFVIATFLIGIFNGFGNYYRFTAADSVDIPYKSKAVSWTMIGGVFAAVIGPNLAKYSREWIEGAEFAGGYMAIIALYIANLFVLNFLKIEHKKISTNQSLDSGRKLSVIFKQPKYIVAVICGMLGYGVMSFVMTATPLAMDKRAFLFDDTSLVIQWHVLAMFVPSFFTGNLIARFGTLPIMVVGTFLGLGCVAINLMGSSFYHFVTALAFLGLGWNFLFVGSTSLLTETYQPEERNKAQALNDFIVFTTVALSSLSSGALQNVYGWQVVNAGVIPLLSIILLSIAWLKFSRHGNFALRV
jgi:MFS family permease